jgi:Asp-tRNA(Asn)/Glu-tRNA(Gln) amidotransferase A subunit family amidase
MFDNNGVSRKQFLTGLLLTAAATALPKSITQGVAPKTAALTVDDIKSIEKLLAIDLTDEERKALIQDVQDIRDGFVEIRNQPITYLVEPPTVMSPLAPPEKNPKITVKGSPTNVSKPTADVDLAFMSTRELSHLVRTKQVSPVELTKLYLSRLEKYGEKLLCVVTLTADKAMEQAKQAEDEIMRGHYRGPLHGVPYGIKDLFAAKGYPTTWGAEPYKDQVFDYDCAVVEKLNAAGAVMLAKLSMGALALGDQWFRGQTRNPWDLTQGSSGSSAGSAAATAAGLVGFSIGTETLGSVVSPSLQCRVTGLRPTYGRTSRYGAMAVSWTMDKVGTLCREAEDCAMVFAAITGADPRDRSSVDRSFKYDAKVDLSKLKIGFLTRSKTDTSMLDKDEALKILVAHGAKPVPVTIEPPVNGLYAILEVEGAAAFDQLVRSGKIDEIKNSPWPETYRANRFMPAVEYLQAMRARTLLMHRMVEEFGDLDLIVAAGSGGQLLTITNFTGHPQVLIPMGAVGTRSAGTSLIGKPFGEATLLAVAKVIQDNTPYHKLRPKGFE